MRADGFGAQTGDLVLLVSSEVALEPVPVGGVLVGAFSRQNVGGNAVKEPAVVRGDHHTAGELK